MSVKPLECPLNVRLPKEQRDWLERKAQEYREQTPGRVGMSDVLRLLIAREMKRETAGGEAS